MYEAIRILAFLDLLQPHVDQRAGAPADTEQEVGQAHGGSRHWKKQLHNTFLNVIGLCCLRKSPR
jgi:hypothetical protein